MWPHFLSPQESTALLSNYGEHQSLVSNYGEHHREQSLVLVLRAPDFIDAKVLPEMTSI